MNLKKLNTKCRLKKLTKQLEEISLLIDDMFSTTNVEEYVPKTEYVSMVTPYEHIEITPELMGLDLSSSKEKFNNVGWVKDYNNIVPDDNKVIHVFTNNLDNIFLKDITVNYEDPICKPIELPSNANPVYLREYVNIKGEDLLKSKDYFDMNFTRNLIGDPYRNTYTNKAVVSYVSNAQVDLRALSRGITITYSKYEKFNTPADFIKFVGNKLNQYQQPMYTKESYDNLLKDLEMLGITKEILPEIIQAFDNSRRVIQFVDVNEYKSLSNRSKRVNNLKDFDSLLPAQKRSVIISGYTSEIYQPVDYIGPSVLNACSIDLENLKKGLQPLPDRILYTESIHIPLDVLQINNIVKVKTFDNTFTIENKCFVNETNKVIDYTGSKIITKNKEHFNNLEELYTLNDMTNQIVNIPISLDCEELMLLGDQDVLIWKETINGKFTFNSGIYPIPNDEKLRIDFLKTMFGIYADPNDCFKYKTKQERIHEFRKTNEEIIEEKKVRLEEQKLGFEHERMNINKEGLNTQKEMQKEYLGSKIAAEKTKYETVVIDKGHKMLGLITAIATPILTFGAVMLRERTASIALMGITRLSFTASMVLVPVLIATSVGYVLVKPFRTCVNDIVKSLGTFFKAIAPSKKTIVKCAKFIFNGVKSVFNFAYKAITKTVKAVSKAVVTVAKSAYNGVKYVCSKIWNKICSWF